MWQDLDELEAEGSAPSAAVPSRTQVRLTNARLVSPLWQGEAWGGLSGLYAIINGIRLALAHKHRFTAAEIDSLMRAGLRFLGARLTPQQCLSNGLRVQVWRDLTNAMIEATRQRIGIRVSSERLWLERLVDRQVAFNALEEAIDRLRVPLILCRGGHFTAVSGVTGLSLLLFDSAGACWITKRVCGVPGDCDDARHVIYPASFLALSV
jgi:hypothetical protein